MSDNRIDQLADSTVAKLRTVVPATWGIIVGQIITWAIAHEWLPDVAAQWQPTVTGATVTVVTGASVWAVYAAARWVEARQGRAAQWAARILLVALTPPTYQPSRDAAAGKHAAE